MFEIESAKQADREGGVAEPRNPDSKVKSALHVSNVDVGLRFHDADLLITTVAVLIGIVSRSASQTAMSEAFCLLPSLSRVCRRSFSPVRDGPFERSRQRVRG